jgi:regulator of protease activity HflC (stomatin/prohibitin superfamily)
MASETYGSNQCILAMVKRSYGCCCCDIKFDVPSNFTVLEEECGKSTGVMNAGAHWCYCCHKRVACMVTKNIVNYDAPIQRCPTKDNAFVDVDIHFTFRLPIDEQLVKAFVYKLGAGRFDELLAAEVEENMRTFINSIWLSQVFDLKSDMANAMMHDLNTKFQSYGILFEQCNVTNVIVNPQLIGALQEKTRLKIELKNHEKEQENKKLTLNNEEQQKLTDL